MSSDEFIRIPGGDPDFEAPQHVKDAAIKAIQEGGRLTHYAHIGIPEFLEAVVKYYSKYGVKYDSSNVRPTAGSSNALNAVLAAFLKPGDECIVFDPTFTPHFRVPPTLGANVVYVPLNRGQFHMDSRELRVRVTDKSRLMILCNPNNPAGTVYTKEELEAIAEVAIEEDIIILADEIYNEFVYDGRKHIAMPSIDGMRERTVVVMSFSKTFAMTGWRLGYYIVPEELNAKISGMPVATAPSTFVQMAGAAALNIGGSLIRKDLVDSENYEELRKTVENCLFWIREARGKPLFLGVEHPALYATEGVTAETISEWYVRTFGLAKNEGKSSK